MPENRFNELIQPYLSDIRTYCKTLTGGSWDTEDLIQETLLKIHKVMDASPERAVSKAYFRRIAYTSWIDMQRNGGPSVVPMQGEPSMMDLSWDSIGLREAFELFADNLSLRQMVYMLLVDIFGYTAKETAALIHASEGAVKEGVKRARKRLKMLSNEATESSCAEFKYDERPSGSKSHANLLQSQLDTNLFETFLEAIRKGNARTIYETYISLNHQGVQIVQAHVENRILYVLFRDPDGHIISFFSKSPA